MTDKEIEKIIEEAKCKAEAQGCDHNCATCGLNKPQPGLWKVYLGFAGAIIVGAIIVTNVIPWIFDMIRS